MDTDTDAGTNKCTHEERERGKQRLVLRCLLAGLTIIGLSQCNMNAAKAPKEGILLLPSIESMQNTNKSAFWNVQSILQIRRQTVVHEESVHFDTEVSSG